MSEENKIETIKDFGLGLANRYHLQNVLGICEQILALEQVQPYTASDLAMGFSLIAQAQQEELEIQAKELEETKEIENPEKK